MSSVAGLYVAQTTGTGTLYDGMRGRGDDSDVCWIMDYGLWINF